MIQEIFEHMQTEGFSLPAIKCILVTDHVALYTLAVQELSKHDEVSSMFKNSFTFLIVFK